MFFLQSLDTEVSVRVSATAAPGGKLVPFLDTEVSVRVSVTAVPGGKLVPFLDTFTAPACNSSGLKVQGYPL